jgi:type I restriction enzyme S subunit
MPNNWKTYSVEELIKEEIIYKPLDGNHGGTHPKGSDFIKSGIPFIMATDIVNGKVDIVNCKFISKGQGDKLRKGFAKTGDVLITHKASIGRTAIVPKIDSDYIMLTPQVTYYRIKDKEELNANYLSYYFNSPFFQNEINTRAGSGSTRAYIGITDQLRLTISFPPIQEQKSIASILSAIDDKIENNLAINKTLEEMAMALYKHWFVDFGPLQDGEFVESELGRIPKGWEVIPFGKIVSKYIDNRGKTPPIEEEGIPLLEVKHISSNLFPDLKVQKYVSENTYNNWFRNHLEEDDIIISTVGTVGLTSLVPTFSKVTIAQNLLGLRFDSNLYPTGFMFYLMKSPYFLNQIENRLIITVQKSIKRSDLDKIPCLIPNQKLINSFNEIVICYIKQIESNLKENQTLTQLRDTLLPKLISGEVRLKEFRESITN